MAPSKKVTYETLLSSQLQSRLTHPMICCLQPMRSYWGPHKAGKIVLILREKPGCSITQLGRFASWDEGKCAAKVKAIALATKKGSQMMSVEYVTPASDGRGRLYARHRSGLRAYKATPAAHLWRGPIKKLTSLEHIMNLLDHCCKSQSLPPISALRRN